jgi:hypothetical protein
VCFVASFFSRSKKMFHSKLAMEIDRGKAVADISKNVLAIWNMQVRIAESQDAALRPE